jgi:hypothetical protein
MGKPQEIKTPFQMEQDRLTKQYNKKLYWHKAHRRWAVFWYIIGVISIIGFILISGPIIGGIIGVISLIVFVIIGKISDRASRHSYQDAMSISQQIQVNAANANVSNTTTTANQPNQFNPKD